MFKKPKYRWRIAHRYGGYTVYRENNKWYWVFCTRPSRHGPFITLKAAKKDVENADIEDFEELRREFDPSHPEYRYE